MILIKACFHFLLLHNQVVSEQVEE